MKCFVWLNCDVIEVAVVHAKSEREAWETLYHEQQTAWWVLQGQPEVEGSDETHSESAKKHLDSIGKYRFDRAYRPNEKKEPFCTVAWAP